MPSTPGTSRGYCFTLNNPTPTDLVVLKNLSDDPKCRYICYGHEVGEQGTYHLQGYVHFHNQIRFRQAKILLGGRVHLEKRRGTIEQAIAYCKKDSVFEEFGEKPVSPALKNRTDWAEILKKAEAADFSWIKENHPRIWVNLSSKLQSLSAPKTEILPEIQNEWWVGTTGTGKSRTLWELYPNHFQKELNKWWCGYTNEDVVAIEEWSPKNECTASHLKIWADRYPFTAQIKGGSLHRIRPKKIIILSNFRLDQCFPDPRDREPLERRFTSFEFPQDIPTVKALALDFSEVSLNDSNQATVVQEQDDVADAGQDDSVDGDNVDEQFLDHIDATERLLSPMFIHEETEGLGAFDSMDW